MSNLLPQIMPPISIDLDNCAPAKDVDPAKSSGDDFASMLASVWFSGQVPQREVPISPEPAQQTMTLDELPADHAPPETSFVPPLPQTEVKLLDETIATDVSPSQVDLKPQASVDNAVETGIAPLQVDPKPKTTVDASNVVIETPVQAALPARDVVRNPEPPIPIADVKQITVERRPPIPITPRQFPEVQPQKDKAEPPTISQRPDQRSDMIDSDSDSLVVVEPARQVADQVTTEAIKREANLVATYLAQNSRDDLSSTIESIKAQVSDGGAESKSNTSAATDRPKIKAQSSDGPAVFAALSFASVLKKQTVESVKDTIAPQITNQILESAGTVTLHQPRSVRLRLRPEELGEVDIQLSRDAGGKVSAHLIVEKENARAVLSQSLPQLRETLEKAGISVDQLNVTSDGSSFTGNSSEKYYDRNGESSRFSSVTTDSVTTEETLPKERLKEHRLLSLSA